MVLLAENGSKGLRVFDLSTNYTEVEAFKPETGKGVRLFEWSHCGKLFAYCNNIETIVINVADWSVVSRLPISRAVFFKWSPNADQLVTFHQYYETKDNPNPGPNVKFFAIPSGEEMGGFIHRGSVEGWEPNWTSDSNFLLRKIGPQLMTYARSSPTTVLNKLKVDNIMTHSVAPGRPPYKVAVFGKSSKKEILLFGKDLLALTATETSSESYYGENTLYLLNAQKGESQTVELKKKGPIYHIEWSPDGDFFCAVYGFMPAKATLYDNKGNIKFDYGTGPRNTCHFNPQGSLLMIAGFGNLRGKMECWDVRKNEKISEPEAPDTTNFHWSPDGEHYIWATTAPRLRVGNGWKISHYHGELKHDSPYPTGEKVELWSVGFQPSPRTRQFEITKPSKQLIQKQAAEKPKGYVPPHARGRKDYNAKIREDEKPSDPNAAIQAVIDAKNNPKSGQPALTASQLKNKKRKEAKKRQAEEKAQAKEEEAKKISEPTAPTSGKSDAEREARKIQKKLNAIEGLKKRVAAGETLEKDQLEKIKNEEALRDELQKLQI
ncbi:Oidioi.mRNA.OKI2018_I69.chr2.g7489.t1.cds [Oikopleura dioica]|uniref:Eukaryotic translation initiation factor 2A n=1 Tax=Oikopleura dioica TaxID=34765 RepID=A0ABN7T6C2_OIKDI|nr:Oidioi.mRNA.OKI2018_I69.chr2.g7489.t1.cds [Oikopleura dioica]